MVYGLLLTAQNHFLLGNGVTMAAGTSRPSSSRSESCIPEPLKLVCRSWPVCFFFVSLGQVYAQQRGYHLHCLEYVASLHDSAGPDVPRKSVVQWFWKSLHRDCRFGLFDRKVRRDPKPERSQDRASFRECARWKTALSAECQKPAL